MLTDERIIGIRRQVAGGRFGRPASIAWSDTLKFARAIESAVLAQAGRDAERLDWMLKHTDATICSGGPYGPYHIWFRYSNRKTDEQPTARAAIDAAMGEKGATP